MLFSVIFFQFRDVDSVQAADPTTQPLVQQSDIQYLGAFLLPKGTLGPSRFGYGGNALGYYKDANGLETLFMEGHVWWPGNVAQVQIPQIIKSGNLGSLQRATLLQSFYDITDGKLRGTDGDRLGSTFVYHGRLIVGSYVYYDASGSQRRFIGDSGFDLTVEGNFSGFFAPSGIDPGKLGRYITTIPAEWHLLLGGPALSGACCLSIISRTNSGPGVSVFNPDEVGVLNPVPFKEVLGYPLSNPVKFGNDQGSCGGQSSVFNCTTNMNGVAFPAATRSVLFFGSQGTGPVCYKNNGPASCQGTGGYNAPPYAAQVWAYDANDLVAVKNGAKQPWQVRPYAVWQLNFPIGVSFSGATFDPATDRMFLIERNGEDPIVHALRINTTGARPHPPQVPPAM